MPWARRTVLCCLQLGDKPGSCNPDPNGRSIVVQITDQCPECEANHMDIQALTWAKVRRAPLQLASLLRVASLPWCPLCEQSCSSGPLSNTI